jgi:hypothetical protein
LDLIQMSRARAGAARLLTTFIRRLIIILAACVLAGLVTTAEPASDPPHNLLNNGDLARGSGGSCDGWRTDGWILSPSSTSFNWIAPAGGYPGQLEVDNLRDNDSRWSQPLSLSGGWYHMSVWARTEDVLPYFTGANISVLEGNIVSADLRGTQPWQKLELYLKVPHYGADVEVALRLGGYANLTRGKAFFRDARVDQVDAPPTGATHVYDLAAIRKAENPGPIGRRWTLYATFLVLMVAAIAGWRLFMFEPDVAIASEAPSPVARAALVSPKKRRKKKSQRHN